MPGPARAGALIYAREPGLLSHFYRTLLQMEIRSQSEQLIVLENGDIQLLVHAIPSRAEGDVIPRSVRRHAASFSATVTASCTRRPFAGWSTRHRSF